MEYLWICGPSAVGKRTLIEKLTHPQNIDLRARFGIAGSVEHLQGDPQGGLQGTADHVLIKWQFGNHVAITTCRAVGTTRIVLLWRHFEDRLRDMRRRRSCDWDATVSEDVIRQEWRRVSHLFRELEKAGVPVELVDASVTGYPPLTAWPAL